MTGLLHRLGSRAAGAAVSVRSDARLPYSAPALGWTDATEPEEVVAPRPQPDPVAPRPQPDPVTPPRDSAKAELAPRPLLPQTARRPAVVAAALARTESPQHAPPPERPAPAEAASARSSSERTETSAAPAPAMSAREPPEARTFPARPEAPGQEHRRGAPQAQGRDPPLLLPPSSPRPPNPPARISPDASARRVERALDLADAAAENATEVHVHIGRIDVTAVHAPPPSREARAMPPPVSLDDYLARRGRA